MIWPASTLPAPPDGLRRPRIGLVASGLFHRQGEPEALMQTAWAQISTALHERYTFTLLCGTAPMRGSEITAQGGIRTMGCVPANAWRWLGGGDSTCSQLESRSMALLGWVACRWLDYDVLYCTDPAFKAMLKRLPFFRAPCPPIIVAAQPGNSDQNIDHVSNFLEAMAKAG